MAELPENDALSEPTRVSLADAERVHLIGIGGSGMAALASLLLDMGKKVSGSDSSDTRVVQALGERGATVYVGHEAKNVGQVDIVVRSSAVPESNEELVEATLRELPSLKLSEAVADLMADRVGVGVAGTHGKTTTTALVTWLLDQAGMEPTALIGAEALNFGTSAVAGEGPFVIEADEYDRRFLDLSPECAIVTSIEPDHLDYFRDLDEIKETFQQFVDKLPDSGLLIVCADNLNAAALTTKSRRETYGFTNGSDWQLSEYQARPGGGSKFRLTAHGRPWELESALVGEHNALNAAAAIAIVDYFGVGMSAVLSALPRFLGTARRFQVKGERSGVLVIDDYAHHPTAVAATLHAARAARPEGALWAIFQPHTAHRTSALMKEFAAAFDEANHAIIVPIYRPGGREQVFESVGSEDLVRAMFLHGHPDAQLAEDFAAARAMIAAGTGPGDTVLVMGAGDVTKLADDLLLPL